MKFNRLSSLTLVLVTASSAFAVPRLVTRSDITAVPAHVFDLSNLAGGSIASPNLGVTWGMAANDIAGVVYTNNGSTLQAWQYDTWTQVGSNVTLQVNMVSLAFNPISGKLYGTRNISGTGFPEGLYEIDPATGTCTLVNAYNTGFDLGGLDVDAATGKMYAINDGSATATPRGIYVFDPTLATLTKIGDYPTGRTDIDGLGCYNNVLYLCEDGGTASDRIWVYDVTANAYTADYPVAWTNSGTFSGACVINVFSQVQVTGTVDLQNWNPSPAGSIASFEILDSNSNVVDSDTATLGAGGAFSFGTSVSPGTYTVTAKASHWLKKAIFNVSITTSGASGLAFSLKNGDVNNDNEVGPADFTIMSAAFGTMLGDPLYNASADLNGDDEVGPADFTILSTNFGEQGD